MSAYSAAVCSDTFNITSPVELHPVPQASFAVNQNAGCPVTTFDLSNTALPYTGLTYSWNIAGNLFSTQNLQ